MKESVFKPFTDVEEYLTDDFNLTIYDQLTGNEKYKGMFEALEFFNLLYEQYGIVQTNLDKPLSITKHLLKLDLKKEQLHYLLYHLYRLLSQVTGNQSENENNRSFTICQRLIKKEYDKLEKELYPKGESSFEKYQKKFDINKIKKHLDSLPDNSSRLKYLTDIKTEVKQNQHDWDVWRSTAHNNFISNIELEIIKIKDFQTLDNPSELKKAVIISTEFTNSQLVLIFFYFLKHNGLEPRKNIDVSPIAKFLHLITGKEYNTIHNSDFYKKLQSVPNFKSDKELIKDLESIKPLFGRVQLMEIVKMIDNEIEMARNELNRTKTK